MKQLFAYAAAAAFCLTVSTASAQNGIETPQPSPEATLKQKVGLTDVTIVYSRPGVKGRKIFGDLVPYGKLWRTGANSPTKISFSDDVTLEGKKVAKGEYVLYTIPNTKEWTIIINNGLQNWGADGYKEANDLVRFNVKPEPPLAKTVERFTIDVADMTNSGANIVLAWEKTMVKFKIDTDVETKVMADINEKVVKGTDVSPEMYFSAARYYYDNNKDMKLAYEWVQKANAKDPKFWMLHQQAKIERKMKNIKGATETAKRSLEMAKKEKNDDYVKMNEKLIEDMKSMK